MGIHIAAGVVSLIVAAIACAVMILTKDVRDRRLFLLVLACNLPLSAAAFHGIRMPLDSWLQALLADQQGLLTMCRTCYAPLTEETAKLAVLLIPAVRLRLQRGNLALVALGIGLGFGTGEAWMLAERFALKPEIAALPWYSLQGFIFERSEVCFTHAGFTSLALLGLIRTGWPMRCAGILAAMAAHFVANAPIWLVGLYAKDLDKQVANVLLWCWVQACVVASVAWLCHLGAWNPARLILRYRVRCPGCGATYDPPFLALNLMDRRYEKCPQCRRWHLITVKDRLPLGAAPGSDA